MAAPHTTATSFEGGSAERSKVAVRLFVDRPGPLGKRTFHGAQVLQVPFPRTAAVPLATPRAASTFPRRAMPHLSPSYSRSKPCVSNLRVRLFSVTVRTTCSGTPPGTSASMDTVRVVGIVVSADEDIDPMRTRHGAEPCPEGSLAPASIHKGRSVAPIQVECITLADRKGNEAGHRRPPARA